MEVDKVLISQEILRRLGIKFKPDRTKQSVSCWDHGPDKTPSMSIDLEKSIYHCFACGSSGTLKQKYWETFHRSIYKDMGMSFSEIDLLKIKNDDELKADFTSLPEVDLSFEGKLYPITITEAGKIWLKQRGFTEKDLKAVRASYTQYGVCKQRSDPTNKKEWIYVINRVIIPVYENHNILSYELRDIMGKSHYEAQLKKKNLSIDDYPYKKLLYPKHSSVNTLFDIDQLKVDEPLYIVEGLMDLISLRTHGAFKNSTCLFHCIPTERQYFLLEKFQNIIYIVNNDLPGLMGCKKLMERNPNTSFLCPPETVNDVNDILQGKDKRFNSIKNLVEDWNWLSMIKKSISDIDFKIKKYSNEVTK